MTYKVIGLTGSIATGKSTVGKILRDRGFLVVNSDKIGHKLMEKGEKNYYNIISYFGRELLDSNGSIDRAKLADRVFKNEDDLNKLNELTHTNIFNKIEEIVKDYKGKIVFIELPLLFELMEKGKLKLKTDENWLVYANRSVQLARLMARDGLTEEDAKNRINKQMDIEKKRGLADFIIDNSRDIEWLNSQIEEKLRSI